MSGKKTSPKTQAQEPQEPFSAVAQQLGNALAATVAHPDCPGSVRDAIAEMDTTVFNNCPSLEISLRHGFAQRLTGLLAAEAERPAD